MQPKNHGHTIATKQHATLFADGARSKQNIASLQLCAKLCNSLHACERTLSSAQLQACMTLKQHVLLGYN
jgi:hypothetical protein